jgi:hypothetical protein
MRIEICESDKEWSHEYPSKFHEIIWKPWCDWVELNELKRKMKDRYQLVTSQCYGIESKYHSESNPLGMC